MIDLRSLNPMPRWRLLTRRDANLATIMDRLGEIHGDHVVATEAGDSSVLTFSGAAGLVSSWAGGIAAQTAPGDRVVIATPNGYAMFLLCLAASKAGTIPVPLNPQMRADEIDHVTDDCGATLVIRNSDEVEGFPSLSSVSVSGPDDVAALFYTSGTTGKPKGAELTHKALVGQVAASVAWPAHLHRDEIVVALPVAHIMGFSILMVAACTGVPVHLIPHFRPDEVLDAIETRRATVFVGVPTMYRMMLEAGAEKRDLSSIRLWAAGADVMPTELARTFKKLGASVTLPLIGPVGEATFAEGYGLVETAGGVAGKISPPCVSLGLGEAIGFGLPGYRIRVVGEDDSDVRTGEVGELWVKGPGVIRGYWGASEDVGPDSPNDPVTDDGWLRTGDLVKKGPFGIVGFVSRNKEVIKHGGFSVFAPEVQRVLEEHPAVVESVVIGLPDEILGEVPVAVVRLAGGEALDDIDLGTWATERLSDYKVPKRFVAVDDFPRTGTDKVQRVGLSDLFAIDPV